MIRLFAIGVWTAAVFQAMPVLAQGFGPSGAEAISTASSTGSAEIVRRPDRMRVNLDLLARGRTVKEALERLKERQTAIPAELQKLGAVKESVTIGGPRIAQPSEEMNQLRQMLSMRVTAGGRGKPDKKPVKLPVTVMASLQAEWKLDGQDAGELLIRAEELQEKIQAADLAGSAEALKLSPEEQEILEEAEQAGSRYESNEAKPGQPRFLFVAAVSADEHDRALAEAFQKAKSQAARLAKAAGTELGALESLSSSAAGESSNENYDYRSFYDAGLRRPAAKPSDSIEATGSEAGEVTYRITVTASFALKQ